MKTIAEKQKKVFELMKGKFHYKNVMQTPKIKKAVVNVGVGSLKDKKKGEAVIVDRLTKITGQKPSARPSKKSIASFKVRQGDIVGYQVTLRGKRLEDFLNRFLNVALPRTKDFRGISDKAIDEMGNITVGIKEHIIFPETTDEELKDVFGMAITFTTTAKNKEEAKAYFEILGFPFKKEGNHSK
ncbi:50S ribosomal protein L5 [Candidatus Nomurabacteria bacterium]|nr:50S ribosomal protein L5 [Candidatus Nomurabacteria bacterium]